MVNYRVRKEKYRKRMSEETPEHRRLRLDKQKFRQQLLLLSETPEEKEIRLERQRKYRKNKAISLKKLKNKKKQERNILTKEIVKSDKKIQHTKRVSEEIHFKPVTITRCQIPSSKQYRLVYNTNC